MALTKLRPMICFVVLSVSSCQTTSDSYCLVYTKVIQGPGDGSIQAPLAVKKRIAANEVTYRQLCKKG